MEFLKGKKTYIIVALFAIAVIIPAATDFVIPEWVFGILGALGLGAVRLGIQSVSGNTGWRTYLAAIVVGFVAIADAVGWTWIPVEMIYTLAGALGLVGIRKAVADLGS